MMASLTRLLTTSLLLLASTTTARPLNEDFSVAADSLGVHAKISFTHPSHLAARQTDWKWPAAINSDFPDPCIVQHPSGLYYAFATNGNGKHIQMATAKDPFGAWTLLNKDAMPAKGWTSGAHYWAPDVSQLEDGSWLMYFSGELPNGGRHCVGVARSKDIEGPYVIDSEPLVCHSELGGSIDPSLFVQDGTHYITYKIDGLGGSNPSTPLMLQQVTADGRKTVGDPKTLLTRIPDEGLCIEAPDLILLPGGRTGLFYSSHFFNEGAYDVRYATAMKLEGPYTRAEKPVLQKPMYGLFGPGGWQSLKGGNIGVFHGWCREHVRCMYITQYTFS